MMLLPYCDDDRTLGDKGRTLSAMAAMPANCHRRRSAMWWSGYTSFAKMVAAQKLKRFSGEQVICKDHPS